MRGVDLLADDVGDVDERRAAAVVAELAHEQVDDDGREQPEPDDGRRDDRGPSLRLGGGRWLAARDPAGLRGAAVSADLVGAGRDDRGGAACR